MPKCSTKFDVLDLQKPIEENNQLDESAVFIANELSEVRNIINKNKSRVTSGIKDENEYSLKQDLLEKRSEKITDTLRSLTEQQIYRYKFRRVMQIIISVFFMVLVVALTIALIVCINYVLKSNELDYIKEVSVLVGSCITYLTSVITIVAVIVKYTFPENEDKLMTDLISKVIEEEQLLLNDEMLNDPADMNEKKK